MIGQNLNEMQEEGWISCIPAIQENNHRAQNEWFMPKNEAVATIDILRTMSNTSFSEDSFKKLISLFFASFYF